MIHWLKSPDNPELAKYIDCYWFLEKSPNAEGNNYPKLNPDPAAHLIVTLPKQIFQYKSDSDVTQVQGSHWLFPYGNTYELDHSKPVACIGIKFHVGALYSLPQLNALQGKAMQAFVNSTCAINVEEMFASDVTLSVKAQCREIELLTLARNSPDDCCEMLDNLCRPWLLKSHEDKHSEITRRILPLLSNTVINELGKILNCSQRTLERSFLKVTGLTLKQCQSMNKLEAILEFLYLREKSEIDWVDIAYQFGFSDQPHLIRYLKKQLGLTPQDYARQRGFTIDVYGGVDSL
ncbi:AraC family transcriptional regulator [Colwellia sp. 75C3]|uniref:helix-turn-helix domain-containing protein n=1 Tax=Colwellia sp. 75C3 TaxID=888425 RepID=UPI000C326DBB|nr:helix-turn-helix domain-containing protein [Colwellia sp. 75C3]PKG81388.1 AraC family transcriptional regulator [Colwellia sp. 75C3]